MTRSAGSDAMAAEFRRIAPRVRIGVGVRVAIRVWVRVGASVGDGVSGWG